MICINLFPWRESKLRKQRIYFHRQLVAALILPLLFCMVFGFYQHRLTEAKAAEIDMLKTENRQLIVEMDEFEILKASYQKQMPKFDNIKNLLDKRFVIPGLLLLLQQQNLDFVVSYLSINQAIIRLKITNNSASSALSLLNDLRSQSNFCEVRFTPIDGREDSQLVQYELHAQICNE